MIGVTCAQGLLLWVVMTLAVIGWLYLRSSIRRRRMYDKHYASHLFTCDHCHYAFLNKDQLNLVRCPRCNSICIRKRRVR